MSPDPVAMYSVTFRVPYTPYWKRLEQELRAIGASLRPHDAQRAFLIDVPMPQADAARQIAKRYAANGSEA